MKILLYHEHAVTSLSSLRSIVETYEIKIGFSIPKLNAMQLNNVSKRKKNEFYSLTASQNTQHILTSMGDIAQLKRNSNNNWVMVHMCEIRKIWSLIKQLSSVIVFYDSKVNFAVDFNGTLHTSANCMQHFISMNV